jgi:flagellar M-ring protein FliF
LKYLLLGGVGLYMFFGIVRPAIRNYLESLEAVNAAKTEHAEENIKEKAKEFEAKKSEVSYESSVQQAKQMANQSPKIVASVIQEWVGE